MLSDKWINIIIIPFLGVAPIPHHRHNQLTTHHHTRLYLPGDDNTIHRAALCFDAPYVTCYISIVSGCLAND